MVAAGARSPPRPPSAGRSSARRGTGCAFLLLLLLPGLATACSATDAAQPDAGQHPRHELELLPSGQAVARRTDAGAARWDADHVFTVHNRGPFSFPYLLESSAPWLAFAGPANGTIAAAKSMAVEVSIDAVAAPAAPGRHLAEVRLLNAITFHRQLALEVVWLVGAADHPDDVGGAAAGSSPIRTPGSAGDGPPAGRSGVRSR